MKLIKKTQSNDGTEELLRKLLTMLPSIGNETAQKATLFIVNDICNGKLNGVTAEYANAFIDALNKAKSTMKYCNSCFGFTTNEDAVCESCKQAKDKDFERSKYELVLVQNDTEKRLFESYLPNKYSYFVLGLNYSTTPIDKARTSELFNRLEMIIGDFQMESIDNTDLAFNIYSTLGLYRKKELSLLELEVFKKIQQILQQSFTDYSNIKLLRYLGMSNGISSLQEIGNGDPYSKMNNIMNNHMSIFKD